jgi:glutamine amidotransferase
VARLLILDYGAGNLYSISTAIRRRGVKVQVSGRVPEALEYDGLILPGVGNFTPASQVVVENLPGIQAHLEAGRPLLGICLGLQLFFEASEEGPGRGLALFPGRVVRLPRGVKTPHMGWNNLHITKETPLLEGIPEGAWVYFVHTYYPRPRDLRIAAATTRYGVEFPAVVAEGHIYGTQFHPEKSGPTGGRILDNFLAQLKGG